jgi:hypothetical protein
MMKFIGLFALVLSFSFSSFAQTKYLSNCGGSVTLASDAYSATGYSIVVRGIQNCSNYSTSSGKYIKLTQNSSETFGLSYESVSALKGQGLYITVQSNSGKTSDVISFRVSSGPRFIQSMNLGECGGRLELYKQDSGRLSIKFIGVTSCSNFIINQTQERYKLTDGDGDFQTRSFTLSNDASRHYRLDMTLRSNSGKTEKNFVLTNP